MDTGNGGGGEAGVGGIHSRVTLVIVINYPQQRGPKARLQCSL